MRFPRAGQARRDPDPAASMALLNQVLDPPVGPGYSSAAEAREAAGLPRSSGFATPLMFVTALAFGVLLTVSALTLRVPDPVAAETRAQLVTRIEAAEAAGDDLRERVETLRAELLELEQAQTLPQGSAGEGGIAAAGLQVGAAAVQGPGVLITLQDAVPEAAGPGERPRAERVNARDIQLVVNRLWSAGAEAISVNGHRLTSTSAIRYAGEAIIVDFRGLAPPYEIRAIGDPERLAEETSRGMTGAYLSELRSQLGIRSEVGAQEQITIGAAERLTTRVGRVPEQQTSEDTR
ncbi:DUF881 domain-containing protein [Ornithinimicrobium humiphilum]|uniref:Uncharacterized protein YlxW (UPF0749 family) n=1 Tax=Ornithinimicrobium humiphilum TaxID=125288 RepID=A0A543KNW9_9MICO|nr:DUF881 domain-containing protein [Ornithinimicrobium humiphilum]TQM96768.1 uncharacterized protein YlxW (UPF0749 family) [Ornithinimicrobium humiphilum]